MQKEPDKRIGYADTYEIMKHPWFKDLDWEALKNFAIEPPIKPEVKDKFDTENFNKDVQKDGELTSDKDRGSQGVGSAAHQYP